jgi:hypothetical protein
VPIALNELYRPARVELAANNYGYCKVVDKTKPGAVSVVEELLSAA